MKLKAIDTALKLFEPEFPYQETLSDYLDMILPEVQQWSEDLEEEEYWLNTPWLEINDNDRYRKIVHVFRPGGVYLRAEEGRVRKGKWEALEPYQKLMLTLSKQQNNKKVEEYYLYNRCFLDGTFFILQLDDEKTYLALGHELQVGRLEWLTFVETLFFRYNNRKDNVVLIAILIVLSWRRFWFFLCGRF